MTPSSKTQTSKQKSSYETKLRVGDEPRRGGGDGAKNIKDPETNGRR